MGCDSLIVYLRDNPLKDGIKARKQLMVAMKFRREPGERLDGLSMKLVVADKGYGAESNREHA